MEVKEATIHLPNRETILPPNSNNIPYMEYSLLEQAYPEDEQINEGASGEVYRSGNFAIKHFTKDFELRELSIELNIYSSVNHDCIIKPVAWSFHNNIGYLVMPLGEDIKTAYKNKKIKIEEIISDILSAIAFLNENGIAHCDIKPYNIVFHDNKAKLIDMGIAKYAELNKSNNTYYIINGAYTNSWRDPEYSYQQYNSINCELYSLAASIMEIYSKNPSSFASIYHYIKQMEPSLLLDFLNECTISLKIRDSASEILNSSPLVVRRYKGNLIEQSIPKIKTNTNLTKLMKWIIYALYTLDIKVETLFLALTLIQRTYFSFEKMRDRKLYAIVIMSLAIDITYTFATVELETWKRMLVTADNDTEEEFREKFQNMKIDVLKLLNGVVMTETFWHYAKSKEDLLGLIEDILMCREISGELKEGSNKCILLKDLLTEEQGSDFPIISESILKKESEKEDRKKEMRGERKELEKDREKGVEQSEIKKNKVKPCDLSIEASIRPIEALFVNEDWKEIEYIDSIPVILHNRNKLKELNKEKAIMLFEDLINGFPNEYISKIVLDWICHYNWNRYSDKINRMKLHPFDDIVDDDMLEEI